MKIFCFVLFVVISGGAIAGEFLFSDFRSVRPFTDYRVGDGSWALDREELHSSMRVGSAKLATSHGGAVAQFGATNLTNYFHAGSNCDFLFIPDREIYDTVKLSLLDTNNGAITWVIRGTYRLLVPMTRPTGYERGVTPVTNTVDWSAINRILIQGKSGMATNSIHYRFTSLTIVTPP